jgi:hypothetical protein
MLNFNYLNMKELIKPNLQEFELSKNVDSFCETHCTRRGREGVCNKACDCSTYSNDSVLNEDDIIF